MVTLHEIGELELQLLCNSEGRLFGQAGQFVLIFDLPNSFQDQYCILHQRAQRIESRSLRVQTGSGTV